DVTDRIETRLRLSGQELRPGWTEKNFNDADWSAIKIPTYPLAQAEDYAPGNFAYYRVRVPREALSEVSHLENEVVLALQYLMFSRSDIYVNGKFFITMRPGDGLESLINIPIDEAGDNLVAIKGHIGPGDT